MIPGIDTGGGGLSNSSSAASRSGDASGRAEGSRFSFTFGGNPNVQTNNYLLFGVIGLAALYLWKRK